MKINIQIILVALALMLLSGCSSHYSTLSPTDSGSSTIYTVPPEKALELAQFSILQAIPGRAISEINGPVRGYSTYTRFVLDTYTQQVLAFPAKGIGHDGTTVCGFFFEVSGQGSSGSGRLYNGKLFNMLKQLLDDTHQGISVKNLQKQSWKEAGLCAAQQTNQ